MEKRSSTKRTSIVNDTLAIEPVVQYNNIEQTRVKLISRFPAKLIYTGQATGKLYVWEKAGAIVEIDFEDHLQIVAKRIGEGACCGSSLKGNLLFDIV